jgi:hypothetical protein
LKWNAITDLSVLAEPITVTKAHHANGIDGVLTFFLKEKLTDVVCLELSLCRVAQHKRNAFVMSKIRKKTLFVALFHIISVSFLSTFTVHSYFPLHFVSETNRLYIRLKFLELVA